MKPYYELRYHPESDLGRKFPQWVIATFATRQAAEAVRHECASAGSIEVVETTPKERKADA